MLRYFDLCILITLLTVWPGWCLSADQFAEEMQFLEDQPMEEVGREAKVQAYEQLLKDHPDHPNRAKAMLKVASLMEDTIPARQIKPDPIAVVAWLRRACEAAAKGSEDWCQAQLMLADRLMDSQPSEAREILETVARFAPGPVVQVEVLYHQQQLELRQGQTEDAAKLCNQLQEWHLEPSRMPDRIYDKGRVYSWMQSAAQSQMFHWLSLRIPKADRLRRMEEFVEKYPTQFNQDQLPRMKEMLETMGDDPLAEAPAMKVEPGHGSLIFIAANLLLVAVVLLVMAVRKRSWIKK